MSRGHVCLVSRAEPGTTGTSRYGAELAPRLANLGWRTTPLTTVSAGGVTRTLAVGRRLGFDPNAFLASYPIRMRWPKADVYHLTSQTYATVLLFNPPPGPVLVTVHDIIPYLVRNDARMHPYRHPVHRVFDWLAMRGLLRADALITDSAWTKRTVVEQLGGVPERITVVPLGVDADRYRPLEVPVSFRERYNLPPGPPYVLYVGSEDPRKNLPSLWRAFAQLRSAFPSAQLLKAGRSHFPAQRAMLERLADELEITGSVRYLDDMPEAELPTLYNAASVYVQPSLYEGFGLPVVEALACGTPTVCARTSALTELQSTDTILVPPTSDGLAEGIGRALCQEPVNAANRIARRHWATVFRWERTTLETAGVYRRLAQALPDTP